MNKKVLVTAFLLGSWTVSGIVSAQSVYPGQHQGKLKKETVAPLQVESFDLKDVRLLPSRFRDNMLRDSAWMTSIDVNRLLHSFRTNAGVFAGDAIIPSNDSDNYVAKGLGQSHNGIYGLGEWRELIDKKTGEAYQISSPGWAGAYPWINKRDKVYGFFISHVTGSSAKEDGFSSFFGSPVISRTVSEILKGNSLVIKQGRINVGNGSLYYEEAGQGEPIIFVHGHSLDHRMWDEQFSVFAKKYHVIRYDLRGYGISSSQTEDYQFMHAEDLITLMDSLRIQKAHIVGLSLGGFITADMLAYFPDRMLSAFLASGNIRKSKGPSEPMTKEEAKMRDEEIAALKKKGVEVMKKEWFEGLMKSGGTQRERMRVPLWQMIDEWDAWQPLHKEVRVVAGLDAIEKLEKSHPAVPALIVEGHSSDNKFSKNPPILNYLPNGKLKVIEDCGHMMNMERPEEFNAALEEFLKLNF